MAETHAWWKMQEENRREDPTRTIRRLATIPLAFLLPVPALAALPVLLAAALVADALRSKGSAARALCFILVYILLQPVGLALAGAFWLEKLAGGSQELFLDRNRRLQGWWAGRLVRTLAALFKLRIEVDGDVPDCAGRVLLVMHSSAADTLLPMLAVAIPQELDARYVLKEELRWDPCLDIVGSRLPNAFIRRGAGESEIRRISALGRGLGQGTFVVLYPEGTRFTPEKKEKLARRFKEKGMDRLAALAGSLQHCLPPRTAGALELLAEAGAEEAVFMAHRGFEGVTSMTDLFNGALLGREIRMHFWVAGVPEDPGARKEWLFDRWLKLDKWLGSQAASSIGES